MRLAILAIGRLGRAPEAALISQYAARIDAQARRAALGPLEIVEIDERGARDAARAGAALLRLSEGAARVALDERGEGLDSRAFAQMLAARRDRGAQRLAFLIGGADGHDDTLRAEADRLLSLGTMTWPHALARLMLVEQIFRAQTILLGHPYHRE